MIFAIIIFIFSGFAQGQVPWWNIPNFYMDPQVPLTTLELALKHAVMNDPAVPNDYDYKKLSQNCHGEANHFGILGNDEESGAIACYTKPEPSPISRRINTALRSLNTNLLNAWAPFLKLFHTAVAKLGIPEQPNLCRGIGGYPYGFHEKGSVVRLDLSFSLLQETCDLFSGAFSRLLDPNVTCTTALITRRSARYIAPYSVLPSEQECIMLPGTLARIIDIIPEQPTTCRIVLMEEIDHYDVPRTTPVKILFNDNLTSAQLNEYYRFLREYYRPSLSVSVAKSQNLTIVTSGGSDNPYNPWPYITNIKYGRINSTNNLAVNQILVGINEYSTRGMSSTEVKQLIESAKKDTKQYTIYQVATR